MALHLPVEDLVDPDGHKKLAVVTIPPGSAPDAGQQHGAHAAQADPDPAAHHRVWLITAAALAGLLDAPSDKAALHWVQRYSFLWRSRFATR